QRGSGAAPGASHRGGCAAACATKTSAKRLPIAPIIRPRPPPPPPPPPPPSPPPAARSVVALEADDLAAAEVDPAGLRRPPASVRVPELRRDRDDAITGRAIGAGQARPRALRG